MTRIICCPILDRKAIGQHKEALQSAFLGGATIDIDCSPIEQIGMAGLQLLASAVRTGQRQNQTVRLVNVSQPAHAAFALAGMRSILLDSSAPVDGAIA
jgi:ABC-type transporter Mla MlaB component